MFGLNFFVHVYIVNTDVEQTGYTCFSLKNTWDNVLINVCNLLRTDQL